MRTISTLSLIHIASILCTSYGLASAQNAGTRFVLTVPDRQLCDIDPYVRMTSLQEAEVNVSIHYMLRHGDAVTRMSLMYMEWKEYQIKTPRNTHYRPYTVQIKSTGPVELFLREAEKCHMLGAGLLPLDRIGHEYVVYGLGEPSNVYLSNLGITSVYDRTDITITLTKPTMLNYVQYHSGETIHRRLDSFQTMWIESFDDVTGIHITSSRPVALFHQAAHMCTQGNIIRDKLSQTRHEAWTTCDYHSFEQLYPTTAWDRQYLLFPIQDGRQFVQIYAAENNTSVKLSGHSGNSSEELSSGKYLQRELSSGDFLWVEANRNVLVLQCYDSRHSLGNDAHSESVIYPQCLVVPSVTPAISQYTTEASPGDTAAHTRINIVIKSTEIHHLMINDSHFFDTNRDIHISLYATYRGFIMYRLTVFSGYPVLLHAPVGIGFSATQITSSVTSSPPQFVRSGGLKVTGYDVTTSSALQQQQSVYKYSQQKPTSKEQQKQLMGYEINSKEYKAKGKAMKSRGNSVIKSPERGDVSSRDSGVTSPDEDYSEFAVRENDQSDVISLNQQNSRTSSGGLQVTVVAVLISVATAILLLIVFVVGYFMSEYVCTREMFSSSKVSPYLVE